MNNILKKLKWIVIIIASVLLLAVLVIVGHRLYENYQYDKLKQQMEYTDSVTNGSYLSIDFNYLKELNPDIYSWINIPNTEVSYPVLQDDEGLDDYYLNHNLDNTYGYPGVIYTHSNNNQNYFDRVTILYGHNMRNGSMFGSLKKYKDSTYFETHPDITIYTPQGIKHYKVYAALTYDDSYIPLSYNNFESKDSVTKFYNDSMNLASNKNYSYKVDEDSKILVLSTCEKDDEDRFLVEAVLVD